MTQNSRWGGALPPSETLAKSPNSQLPTFIFTRGAVTLFIKTTKYYMGQCRVGQGRTMQRHCTLLKAPYLCRYVPIFQNARGVNLQDRRPLDGQPQQ